MNWTIHKWVLNVNAVTNPTQYTKSVKYKVKKNKIGLKSPFIYTFAYLFVIFLTKCTQGGAAN